ncbi:AAA family ATPase [uncultured Mediterranea sp.]|uniref:AAA family ATPase n=1 Tax=uncultured Mediterranea sp. TaxID=1926662 RepID=UPI00280457E1|nr:AAA family ATPase [uncultured Mediterranea sp.]
MKDFRIHIEELGPITDADITLAPVMIFTGASNLGKSYTNFLTYYIFNLFSGDRLKDFIRTKITEDTERLKEFNFSFTISELKAWMEEDVKRFFVYLLNYPDIPCRIQFNPTECTENEFAVRYTQDVSGIVKEVPKGLDLAMVSINNEDHYIYVLQSKDKIQEICFLTSKYLCKKLLGREISHAYLLPPGRASLLNESYSTQAQSSKIGMYDIFLKDFDLINNRRMKDMQKTIRQATDAKTVKIREMINGEVNNKKEGLVLKINEQTELPLSAAASSIRELSPVILWMQTNDLSKDSMCIEEPEAHAHPEMQYSIADLLASCINEGALMQITTHSDYFLARLNQLIRLDKVKRNKPEAFESFCEKNGWDRNLTLDGSLVGAYYFHADDAGQTIKVERMNSENGIPFATFVKAVQEQIEWNDLLEDTER